MPYIGNSPVNVGNYNVLDDIASSFNGTLTTFALTINTGTSISPTQPGQLIINISNVMQEPDALGNAGFTISGSNIVFSSAPNSGDTFWGIFLGTTLDIGIPSELSVGNAQTNFVSTSSAAGLNIKGDGTTDAYIQLNCSSNSHGIKLKSPPHSAAASYTLTLPVSDGNANEVLTTNGSGVLAWSADSTTDSTKLPLAGGAMTGAITTNSTFDGVDIAVRDAILTSTTTTAGAALPKAGGTMTGQLSITDGSLSSPAIANYNDQNTGMLFPADETIAFSAGGTQALKLYNDKKVVVGEEGWDISTGLSVGGTDNANIMNIFTPLSSTSTWGGLGFGASNTSKAAIIYQRHSSYSVGSLSICVNADADLTHADLNDKVVNFSNDKSSTFYGLVNAATSFQLPSLSSAPSSPAAGNTYYNTGTSKVLVYDGSAWQTVGPAAVAYRYTRYYVVSASVSHHPRISRIFLIQDNGTHVQIYNATASDNCSDSGDIPANTASYTHDAGAGVTKVFTGFGWYSTYGGSNRGSNIKLEGSHDNSSWTQIGLTKDAQSGASCGEQTFNV